MYTGPSILQGLLSLCINQAILCESQSPPPSTQYYHPEKACYVNGVFYTQCKDRYDRINSINTVKQHRN